MKTTAKTTLIGVFMGASIGMIAATQTARAQQVVDPAAAPANQSSIKQSLNGTAVQNIAAPNSTGLSHNKFTTFNVDTGGLVINNSRINAVSNIGGAVVANPNLAGGEARMILNEVTSGNRSVLQGPQELLGSRAAYILANPNGITCDGCGFINFPRATLTTGSPVLSNGAISGFTVNGGDVLVGPHGLNATGADYFDILTRSAVINGQVNANDLSLVLGRNQVDYATLAATPLAAAGTAPSFALDSTALGGMYANRIWLRSTEAGVGVRALGTVAASVSDVTLDINGKITFTGNAVSAAHDVVLAGTQAQFDGATVTASNDTSLQAGDVTLTGGRLGAARDLQIRAAALSDSGGGLRDAGRDLTVQVGGVATVAGSTLQAGRNLTATAGALSLAAGARVMGEADGVTSDGIGQTRVTATNALSLQDSALFGGGTVDLAAGSVSVDAASNALGTRGIRGAGAVTVTAPSVDNAGLIASDSALTVRATTLSNQSGALMQGASADVTATTLLTNAGTLGSTGALTVTAGTLNNQSLAVMQGASASLAATALTNAGTVGSNGALTVTASTLDNRTGALMQGASANLAATATLNNAGTIGSTGALAVTAGKLANQTGALMQGGSVDLAAPMLANAGTVGSTGTLAVHANTLSNQGTGSLLADGALTLASNGGAANSLVNAAGGAIKGQMVGATFRSVTNSGQMYGQGSLALITDALTNNAGGALSTPGAMTLQQATAGAMLLNAGKVEAGTLDATFANVQNDAGASIAAVSSATLATSSLTNAGQIAANNALAINTDLARGSLLINKGSINGGDLRAWFNTVDNYGTLYGGLALTVGADKLVNNNSIGSGGSMSFTVPDFHNVSTAANAAGIYAVGDIAIGGNHVLENTSAAGQVASIASSTGSLAIDSRSGTASTQSVTNSGGLLFGGKDVTVLVSNQFINQAAAGLRAYTFANTGNVLLGASSAGSLVASAQPVTVRNVDSDIEAHAGNVTVNAGVLENTTTDAAPVKTEVLIGRRTAGTFDYDGTLDNSGDLVAVYNNCGTYADNFDASRVGSRCSPGVDMYQEQLAPGTSAALRSRLVAGTDLNLVIKDRALNYISLMAAGRNITVNDAAVAAGTATTAVATFENRAETLRYREHATVYRYDDGGRTWNPAGDCYTSGVYDRCYWSSYDHLKLFTDISLATDPFYYTQGIPSTVQALGTLRINVGNVVNTTTGTTSPTPSAGSTPPAAQAVGAPAGAGSVGSQALGVSALSGTSGLSALSGISSLTHSPFFVPAASPTSPFLYETNPRLMNLAGLYGSDLLLQSLGLDPAKYLRVGDPYFEQQLLREQLLAQAGQLYIADGLAGENDQYRMLMANATTVGEDMKLRVGVALTGQQVANLHKDIVWMVWSEVNGKKVLVPQLYLSDVTRAKLADGARFVASSINVKTEGAVTNSGAFVATQDIAIDAGTTFTNRMGTLVAAGGLNIAAVGDILNQSGTIRGGDLSLQSLKGSVVNQTLTRDETVGGAYGQGTSTVVGQTATIESTGNLNIKAAQDIVSRGGQVTAGQDATLDAGRDITFTAIEKKSLDSSVTNTTGGGYTTTTKSSTQKTEQVGSGLTVGGNLDAKAKRDINVQASSVDVAGNGSVDAGRTINITALGETTSSQTDTRTHSWNSKSSNSTTVETTTGKASTVNFGGSLTVSSGGDTNIKGSDIAVGGDLNVGKIGGNLNVTTFQETSNVSSTSSSSSFFGGEAKADTGNNITESKASAKGTLFTNSEDKTDISSTHNRGSSISVGGNLNAGQGAIKGDVNIKGSDIATGGDMNLAAGGNINVLAAQDTTTVTQSSKSTAAYAGAEAGIDGAGAKFGVDHKESSGSATQKTAKVSSLSSGGNMNINAGGDFTEQGTQVNAGGDIGVNARSIKSVAAQNSYTETGDSLSVSASIGVKAETGLGDVVGSFIDQKGKPSFDMAAASQSLNGLSVPDAGSAKAELSVSTTKSSFAKSGNDAQTSSFKAGGNVTFTAREGDATFAGTQVEAGKSINVSADKGKVNVLAADSSASSSKTTTQVDVSIGASADGTLSASGSGSKDTESSGSKTQTAASFKAGSDLTISAKNDVTLVGTNLQAGGTAKINSTDGRIDFQAARDTSDSTTSNVNANVSVSANISGKNGSVGGGGGKMNTAESSSTGKAGSIQAGNVVLQSKGDITLEGTNIAATDSATIDTKGKLDFKAVEDTYSRTAKGGSGQVGVEAGPKSAGVTVGASKTDESEQSSTKTGGSLSAANLTITAGKGARLEGTQVGVSQDAKIDTGTGTLVLESAVSSSTKRTNDTSAEVGVKGDLKAGSGQGSAKVEGSYEDTTKISNQNASIKVGGTADITTKGIDVKGSKVTGLDSVVQAGTLDTHGANVSLEQRQDVDQSTKKDVKVSVGVIVPGKKTRDEVTGALTKARDSKTGTAIRNKVEDAKTKLGLQTRDEGTENKRVNNVAYADRKSAEAESHITREQGKKDQKADYDRQKADDRAGAERDKALKAIDPKSDAKAQEQAKAKIQADFETKKQANADKADETKHQNSLEALKARDTYADKTLGRKNAAQDKAAGSRERHADEDGKVQLALAAKTSDEAKQTQAKQDQARRKDEAKADQDARKSEAQADNDKAKADNDARKTRVEADKKVQDEAKKDVNSAREKQKLEDAKVDRQPGLSDQEKADLKAANAKKAQDEIAAADKKQAGARASNAHAEAGKLQDNRTSREKSGIDADLKKKEALADADRERQALQPTQEVKDALAKAEQVRKDKLGALDKKRNEDSEALAKKSDVELAAAGTTRDAERAKIAEKHAEGVKRAAEDQEKDQGVADARKKMGKDLDQQRDAKKEEARKDAQAQKDLADLDGKRRKGLDDKAHEKAKKDAEVQADDKLSAKEKADKLKANADQLAKDREEVTATHAKEEEERKAKRDKEARDAEEKAIDPNAPDAQKRKDAIDKKYAALETERETARDEKLKAANEAKKQAEADARVDHDQRVAQAKADEAFEAKVKGIDETHDEAVKKADKEKDGKIKAIDPSKSAEEKAREIARFEEEATRVKNGLQSTRDAEAAKAGATRDEQRAQADKDRSHQEADLAKQRETETLKKEASLKPEERTRRQGEIDKRHTDAKAKADQSLAARKKDIEARRDEEVAAAERKKRDADIDADTALTAKQKAQKKQESEKTFLAAEKAARAKREEAKKELAKLMTPEERAAADALAAKAEAEGARVKNPYALSTKAKYYGTQVKRWKEVVTSFGLSVSTKAPTPDQDDAKQEATLKDLLPLAQQFQTGDQALALRLLRDPAVQTTAAVAAAVGALRAEAREELLKGFAQEMTGKELGVLTVADQRKVLAKEGIELPAALPAAEVTRRFNAYLDASVANLQPTTQQKLEILQSLGMMADQKTADGTVDKAYADAIAKGRNEAGKEMTRLGLPPSKANEMKGMLAP